MTSLELGAYNLQRLRKDGDLLFVRLIIEPRTLYRDVVPFALDIG